MDSSAMRLRLAALLGLIAVVCGASGAHGSLHDRLLASGELDHWRTAVSYHLPHAILAVILSLNVLKEGAATRWAWRFIIVGILLFSGSLYVLAITQVKWLGAITPLGGLSLMLGWLMLALARPAPRS